MLFKKKSDLKKRKEIIRASSLFDASFYLDTNPDVRKAGMDPLNHYCKFGIKEDRMPNPNFDPVWYREYYQDVKIDGIYPFIHYILHGQKENRYLNKDKSKVEKIIEQNDNTFFVDYKTHQSKNTKLKTIAFYLPQFHPFPENDKWWGKGFTEWTNVTKAKPNFVGHYQPHLPIHTGFYDLRVQEVMIEQAKLAKNYGIYGFNYYYYWFDGKILMDIPLKNMLKNKEIDMPFCLTWANENWTRRWDGLENEVLIAQNHSDEDSIKFIKNLFQYFEDERYIRVNNKPLLIIYRSSIIPNMKRTGEIWREEAKKAGFDGLYLVCAKTSGTNSPDVIGFDAAMEFPPHTAFSNTINENLDCINTKFSGTVYDYNQVVDHACNQIEPSYKLFRTAMLSWDNTARRQDNGAIFHNFSIEKYKKWLTSIFSSTINNDKYSDDEKLVFVNAWNEWAEGTHLEPDRKYGYAYLEATHDALRNVSKKGTDLLVFISSDNLKDDTQRDELLSHIQWFNEKTFINISLIFDKESDNANLFRRLVKVSTFDSLNKSGGLSDYFDNIKAIYMYNLEEKYIFDELRKHTIPVVYNSIYTKLDESIYSEFSSFTIPDNLVEHKYSFFMQLLYKQTDFNPAVSIIVPSYNHANFLEKRLNSIFNQTFQDFELFILDDRSKDNSKDVILELIKNRPNVYFEQNKANSGSPFVQWAKGIELANSDIVWIAEDDDYCENNFLHKLLPQFDNNRVRLAYAQSAMIDENDQVIGDYKQIFENISKNKWDNDYTVPSYREIQESLAIRNTIPNASAVLFKKFDIESILDKLKSFKFAGDWYFYLNCIQEGDVAFVHDKLNFHRRHSASTMSILKDDHSLYFNEIKKIQKFIIDSSVLDNQTFIKIMEYLLNEFKDRKLDPQNGFYDIDYIKRIQKSKEYNSQLTIAVFISGYYFGGAEIFPINIANSFADLGHKTYIVDVGTLEEDKRVSNMVSPLVHKVNFYNSENISSDLEKFLIENEIDVINTQGWMATDFVQKNLKNNLVPWFASLHGHEENIIHGGWTKEYVGYFKKAFENVLSMSPTFIYTHEKNLEAFKKYDNSKYNFSLVEIETLGMPKKLPPKKLKSQLNIKHDEHIVGFIARGIEEKGWQEVIESSIIVNEDYNIPTHFILIGDSDYVQSLKKKYNDKRYLHFLGISDEVLAWNQIFDISLLPSFYKSESHPLVIMGYLLCGNPVITTPLGNIPEMLEFNGEIAGHLLSIKNNGRPDSRELAQKIREYIVDKNLYKKHSLLAKRAFEKFNMQIGANKYIEAFRKKTSKKNLYIHIGLPKTGTSAIQKFFIDNYDILKEKYDFCYPEFGRWVDGSHHNIAFSLSTNPYVEMKSNEEQKLYLDELEKAIITSDCKNILLSSECFHLYNNNNFISKFKDKYNIKIICYLRRQDQYLESIYAQNVRDLVYREKLSFKEFTDSFLDRLCYSKMLKNWEKLAQKKDFIIKVYDKNSFLNQNIIDDFLDIFSIPIHKDTSFVFDTSIVNISYAPYVTLYKVLLNYLPIEQSERLNYLLQRYSNETKESPKKLSFMEDTERVELLDKFKEDNNYILNNYNIDSQTLFTDKLELGVKKVNLDKDTILNITKFIYDHNSKVLKDLLKELSDNPIDEKLNDQNTEILVDTIKHILKKGK